MLPTHVCMFCKRTLSESIYHIQAEDSPLLPESISDLFDYTIEHLDDNRFICYECCFLVKWLNFFRQVLKHSLAVPDDEDNRLAFQEGFQRFNSQMQLIKDCFFPVAEPIPCRNDSDVRSHHDDESIDELRAKRTRYDSPMEEVASSEQVCDFKCDTLPELIAHQHEYHNLSRLSYTIEDYKLDLNKFEQEHGITKTTSKFCCWETRGKDSVRSIAPKPTVRSVVYKRVDVPAKQSNTTRKMKNDRCSFALRVQNVLQKRAQASQWSDIRLKINDEEMRKNRVISLPPRKRKMYLEGFQTPKATLTPSPTPTTPVDTPIEISDVSEQDSLQFEVIGSEADHAESEENKENATIPAVVVENNIPKTTKSTLQPARLPPIRTRSRARHQPPDAEMECEQVTALTKLAEHSHCVVVLTKLAVDHEETVEADATPAVAMITEHNYAQTGPLKMRISLKAIEQYKKDRKHRSKAHKTRPTKKKKNKKGKKLHAIAEEPEAELLASAEAQPTDADDGEKASLQLDSLNIDEINKIIGVNLNEERLSESPSDTIISSIVSETDGEGGGKVRDSPEVVYESSTMTLRNFSRIYRNVPMPMEF